MLLVLVFKVSWMAGFVSDFLKVLSNIIFQVYINTINSYCQLHLSMNMTLKKKRSLSGYQTLHQSLTNVWSLYNTVGITLSHY